MTASLTRVSVGARDVWSVAVKTAFVVALSLLMATPTAVVIIPSPSEAQVLAGSNAARRRPPRPAGLTERDRQNLYQAQDEIQEHETAISELNALVEGGATLTPAQSRELANHQRRLQAAQMTVERLEAKRERLGG